METSEAPLGPESAPGSVVQFFAAERESKVLSHRETELSLRGGARSLPGCRQAVFGGLQPVCPRARSPLILGCCEEVYRHWKVPPAVSSFGWVGSLALCVRIEGLRCCMLQA